MVDVLMESQGSESIITSVDGYSPNGLRNRDDGLSSGLYAKKRRAEWHSAMKLE